MSVPAAALSTYETLRAEVIRGEARPEGLVAIAYHGMLRGLGVILTGTRPNITPPSRAATVAAMPLDPEFLHLVANMVLQTQAQVMHVY